MTWTLSEIYRHPVKGLGLEALDEITLTAGQPMPWDRAWAIAHGSAEEAQGWQHPRNFVNQAFVPKLAQIETSYDEALGELTLHHPERPYLSLRPGTPEGDAALTEWIAPLTEGTTRSGPFRVCRTPGVAFTDFEDTHISIASVRSRAIMEQVAGADLQPVRFRMNLWLDGMDPWEEFDLIGREIEIGAVRLKVIGRCTRCNATTANPETGMRDVQLPSILHQRYGHKDFGIYAQVLSTGPVRIGDGARAL